MDHVVGGKFKLGRKIGSGSFGELYLGMYKIICLMCFEGKVCVLLSKIVICMVLDLGVNVQSGEEVAIKLVCSHFRELVCVIG